MKCASAFLVTAETALYFGLILLFPAFSEFHIAVLLFLGLSFLCMMIAETIRKVPVLRAVPMLIPASAVLFLPRSALLLVFAPPLLYILLTAALDRFLREYWRYSRTARILFVIGAALALICLVQKKLFLTNIIVIGLFFLFDVIGLRMLRIGKGGTFRWFLYSLAELLPLPLAGLAAVGIAMLFLRGRKIVEILLTPVAFLFSLFPAALAGLFSWMKPLEENVQESSSAAETAAEETAAAFETTESAGGTLLPNLPQVHINWRLVLAILFIVAAAVVLVLIFRKKNEQTESYDGGIAGGKFYRAGRKRRKTHRAETPAERIRVCYREYLELQYQRGLKRVPGDTSLDILRFSQGNESEQGEARLRELYVKARYRGIADKEEAQEAENLLSELKKA